MSTIRSLAAQIVAAATALTLSIALIGSTVSIPAPHSAAVPATEIMA